MRGDSALQAVLTGGKPPRVRLPSDRFGAHGKLGGWREAAGATTGTITAPEPLDPSVEGRLCERVAPREKREQRAKLAVARMAALAPYH